MAGVLEGFVTIIAVIGLGALLAQIGVLDDGARIVLSRLAFFVASPALMITVLGDADVGDVLSKNLVASAAGVLVSSVVYVVAARFIWHRDLAETRDRDPLRGLRQRRQPRAAGRGVRTR